MIVSLWHLFTDPLLFAPTVGTTLVCAMAGMMGVIGFIRRRSLIGDALSHATYPGIASGAYVASCFCGPSDPLAYVFLFAGAFLFAFSGLRVLELLEKRYRVRPDSALCMVIALSMGSGVTVASRMQMTHAVWYRKVRLFLFGQAVAIEEWWIPIYALATLLTVLSLCVMFGRIEVMYFDREFLRNIAISPRVCDGFLSLLTVAVVVIGMQSVGVLLLAGMFIAPAVFAGQCTDRLKRMFVWAGLIGALSGFTGVYLSVMIPSITGRGSTLSLPTGPMVLLVAFFFALVAILFAPKRGRVMRMIRARRFAVQESADHVLKVLWKRGPSAPRLLEKEVVASKPAPGLVLFFMGRKGWVRRTPGGITLTEEGSRRGRRLVRLHRLWELYLTSELHLEKDRVHRSAEEMEHILTREIEEKLTSLLRDPPEDPHGQPIPAREEIW
ncbi:MAG: metal ABC transporter permease [Simkaniaceae bacterium]|nr:metal ABC transporter permease [Simkaniaceae bacterium]